MEGGYTGEVGGSWVGSLRERMRRRSERQISRHWVGTDRSGLLDQWRTARTQTVGLDGVGKGLFAGSRMLAARRSRKVYIPSPSPGARGPDRKNR